MYLAANDNEFEYQYIILSNLSMVMTVCNRITFAKPDNFIRPELLKSHSTQYTHCFSKHSESSYGMNKEPKLACLSVY